MSKIIVKLHLQNKEKQTGDIRVTVGVEDVEFDGQKYQAHQGLIFEPAATLEARPKLKMLSPLWVDMNFLGAEYIILTPENTPVNSWQPINVLMY